MSQSQRYRLKEIISICEIDEDLVLHYVAHNWVQPVDQENDLFDEEDLARIQLICDLQEKLGVNEEAIPVILHLIDQLTHYSIANEE